MEEVISGSQTVDGASMPLVRANHYRFENADRVTLAKMIQNRPGGNTEPVYAFTFSRVQVVPGGQANHISFSVEDALLGTYVITEAQAKLLLSSLTKRLAESKAP
jgi:hypothetical protein